MRRAYYQAEDYAKALPEWPPFIVTVDVGYSTELYADFSLTGKAYLPFPDPRTYRILLNDLANPGIRDRLRALWLDPHSLDPARHTAKVTREAAVKLATLARNLEQHYPPKEVAEFLTRCIFTSFADSVELLKPNKPWLRMLKDLHEQENHKVFPEMAKSLWDTMNAGGFSPIIKSHILKFNGGLFESTNALPLTYPQLGLLIEAADSNWRDVEPAIFGTLLERALDPAERHSLGAHYTPRKYVERLVVPTLVEPLRADWANIQAAISDRESEGDTQAAIDIVRDFHRQLCNTRVLDPACGSGNFLYVALEHLKRLEGEILETLALLGEAQQALEHTGLTVDPHQLLGLELNPRAAAMADLVLWIGYLQWHFRTRGDAQPPVPVIRNFHNIQHKDALITWEGRIEARDQSGEVISQWDGVTTVLNLATGNQVPDNTARRPVFDYKNVVVAAWPQADFIVGNPPFLGKGKVRDDLGDGYVTALRGAYKGIVPDGADFVMYWWARAAGEVRNGRTRRMGLITTNSITQTMSRRVVEAALSEEPKCSLVFAIPDHPWVDSKTAAQVRIAMTVAERGSALGLLARSYKELKAEDGEKDVFFETMFGDINPNLTIGVNVNQVGILQSNREICGTGLILGSRGFVLSEAEAKQLVPNPATAHRRILFRFFNGHDIADTPRLLLMIDSIGWSEDDLLGTYPEIYQHLRDTVYLERENNRDERLRRNWWLPRRSNEQFRSAISGLSRYIATSETARHRIFVFLSEDIRPEHKLIVTGSDDAYILGVLSSSIHVNWALAVGGQLGPTPVYPKTVAFDAFPFPDQTDQQKGRVRDIAERLDVHRKRQQQLHPSLTLTEMYNALEKLRAGQEFTEQDHHIYDAGLIGSLRELHDSLDRAVSDAYGWPYDLTTEQILERIVELNKARRDEEASGLIRWLRPEYQAPNAVAVTPTLAGFVDEAPAAARRKLPWPAAIPDQFRVIKDAMRSAAPQTPQQIAAGFRPAPPHSRRRNPRHPHRPGPSPRNIWALLALANFVA